MAGYARGYAIIVVLSASGGHELNSLDQGTPDPVQTGSRPPASIADYQLVRYIGQGSMAAVYLAEDQRWKREVALKLLAPELASDRAFRTRMIEESLAAAAIGHPNILPVYEASQADQTLFAAMRYVRGGDARSLLNRLGPLPLGYAWLVSAQVAAALDAAHAQGLIHRDVKPANILLEAGIPATAGIPAQANDGVEPGHAYLADFGMSRAFSPTQAIATGQLVGTLDYVAPEQIEGTDLDGRTDLYSLACTGFELLCGAPPFGQDQGLTLMYAQLYAPAPAATGRRDLPEAVDRVLSTALAKRPADRYPSCGAFAEDLRSALGLRGVELAEPPAPAKASARAPAGPGQASGPWLAARTRASAGPGLAAAEAPTVEQPAVQPAVQSAGQDDAGHPEPAQTPKPVTLPGPAEHLEPAEHPEPTADRPDLPGMLAPADDDETGRRSRALKPVLIGAAVAIVAAAIGSGVALSSQSSRPPATASPAAGSAPTTSAPPSSAPASPSSASPTASPSASPTVTASQQATALGTVLTSSAAARTTLSDAVGQVEACSNLPGAVGQLQDVVTQRSSEYSKAAALTTSALPQGSAVKSELMSALRMSLTADREFLAWAQQQQAGGCTPTAQSAAYNAAYSDSETADAAKQSFVQVWNPVAAKYGIRQDTADMI